MIAMIPLPPPVVLSVQAINPDVLPAVTIDGVKQRIFQLMLRGAPDKIKPLRERLQALGWRVTATDDTWMNVDAAGHTLEQLTALNLQLENRPPGDFSLEVMMRICAASVARNGLLICACWRRARPLRLRDAGADA